MDFELIGSGDYKNPLRTLLQNRGIKDVENYVDLDEKCVHDYSELGDIKKIAELFYNDITAKNRRIHIIVDCDVDGYTSAAVMYKYLENMGITPTYSLHTGKQHGITDDIKIPENTDWLIVPDAATNDMIQCGILRNAGMKILILDHHEKEIENPYAYIVNNQTCDYPNKNLSGVGIVYKFLQSLDEIAWNDEADEYLDLLALGNISDCMDIREPETKFLIEKGLHGIKNKFFDKIIESQSFSIPDGLDIISVQFYITPLLNALIRVGSMDEKEILFRAFVEDESEDFEYKKRGESAIIRESVYDRAVRFCKNAKSKQGRIIDKQIPLICEHIESKKQNKNHVIMTNVTEILVPELSGVAAAKIAERYGKPCILLRKCGEIFSGSVRVPNGSPILNFKDIVNNVGFFKKAMGHQSAFGVKIYGGNVKRSLSILNDYITRNDLAKKAAVNVDFAIEHDDLNMGVFCDIALLKRYYGQCVEECKILIKDIPITSAQISIQGKNRDSWCVNIADETIKLVKFKCDSNDKILNFGSENESGFTDILVYIDVIGRFNFNYYKGMKTAQIIVDEYEVAL